MSHFAQIDENNIVQQVIVIANENCAGGEFPESEPAGQEFIASLGLEGIWKQTSYNSNFRKMYAGIGFSYNLENDVFISPQPYPSWTLNNEDANWQSPVAYPNDGKSYAWNEENQSWEEITPPTPE